MTKEITKAIIIQEIQDKFKLREFEPEVFTFSERVTPIYDIREHLTHWEVKQETESITSGSTPFLFFTVPDKEQWRLRAYQLIFYNAGAYQVSGLYISHRPGAGDYIYLDLKKNQADSYLVNLSTPVILQPSNRLYVLVDTYVSTANLKLLIDVEVEEIR